MDNQLLLVVLISAYFILLAAEKGKAVYLIISFTLIGLGFNIKMLEAYLVLPAFYIVYILSGLGNLSKRAKQLVLATLLLLVISLSWAVIVDLTPKDKRPYITSSADNTVLELMFGHNGLERVIDKKDMKRKAADKDNSNLDMPPKHGSPISIESGSPGIFRLFNDRLSAQISWFLPLILISLFAYIKSLRGLPRLETREGTQLSLWLIWAGVFSLLFSFTGGIFHRYYLSMLAPAFAALAAIGLIRLFEYYNSNSLKKYLLPLALLVSGGLQITFILYSYYFNFWLVYLLLITIPIISLALLIFMNKVLAHKTKVCLVGMGVLALLISPCYWSYTLILYSGNIMLPYAGQS